MSVRALTSMRRRDGFYGYHKGTRDRVAGLSLRLDVWSLACPAASRRIVRMVGKGRKVVWMYR